MGPVLRSKNIETREPLLAATRALFCVCPKMTWRLGRKCRCHQPRRPLRSARSLAFAATLLRANPLRCHQRARARRLRGRRGDRDANNGVANVLDAYGQLRDSGMVLFDPPSERLLLVASASRTSEVYDVLAASIASYQPTSGFLA